MDSAVLEGGFGGRTPGCGTSLYQKIIQTWWQVGGFAYQPLLKENMYLYQGFCKNDISLLIWVFVGILSQGLEL